MSKRNWIRVKPAEENYLIHWLSFTASPFFVEVEGRRRPRRGTPSLPSSEAVSLEFGDHGPIETKGFRFRLGGMYFYER